MHGYGFRCKYCWRILTGLCDWWGWGNCRGHLLHPPPRVLCSFVHETMLAQALPAFGQEYGSSSSSSLVWFPVTGPASVKMQRAGRIASAMSPRVCFICGCSSYIRNGHCVYFGCPRNLQRSDGMIRTTT